MQINLNGCLILRHEAILAVLSSPPADDPPVISFDRPSPFAWMLECTRAIGLLKVLNNCPLTNLLIIPPAR